MEVNELMVGDWVHCITDNTNVQIEEMFIDEIYGWCYKYGGKLNALHDIEPIPLTSEILEKNKFPYAPKADGYFVGDLFLKGNGDIGYSVGANIHIDNGDGIVSGIYYTFAKIRYVHELKHVLRLCGIDKEITL